MMVTALVGVFLGLTLAAVRTWDWEAVASAALALGQGSSSDRAATGENKQGDVKTYKGQFNGVIGRTWRCFYLQGAKELREGISNLPTPNTASPDVIRAMPLDMLFDFMAIRLNGPKANGLKATINLNFPPTKDQYTLTLINSVLNSSKIKLAKKPRLHGDP
jgi:hypothetical protein